MSDHGNSTTPTIQVPAQLGGRRKTARSPRWWASDYPRGRRTPPAPAGRGGPWPAVAAVLDGVGHAFWMAALLFVVGSRVVICRRGRRRAKDRLASR